MNTQIIVISSYLAILYNDITVTYKHNNEWNRISRKHKQKKQAEFSIFQQKLQSSRTNRALKRSKIPQHRTRTKI